MQVVLCLFLLFATFYLASAQDECWLSLLWPSSVKCEQKVRHGLKILQVLQPGKELNCFCKSNCFPVAMTCKRFSRHGNIWVVGDNRCSHNSSLPFVLGDAAFPGLSASFSPSGNKVKFTCKEGLEMRGSHVAFCEKGDLHFAHPEDGFPRCVAPFEYEGSGMEFLPDDDFDDKEIKLLPHVDIDDEDSWPRR